MTPVWTFEFIPIKPLLPRAQAHPEVMQGTADLHHHIADALLPEADAIFHHATALHATVDMLDPQPTVV
jgi:hypothetical protein